MSLDLLRARTVLSWTLAGLCLTACSDSGKEPAAPAPSSATPTPVETPAAQPKAPETAAPGLSTELSVPASEGALTNLTGTIGGAVPSDEPVEYEEGVEKPLVTRFPEAAPEPARPKLENLPSDDELFGKPLVIAGQVVPFEDIKREVCLGHVGVTEIEERKIQIYVQQEIERRRAEGAAAADIDVSPSELEAFMKELEDEIKKEYPEGGLDMNDLMAGLASNDPRERLRTERLFQKLFLPDDPALFPPSTLEAILKNPGGESILEHYKTTHASGENVGRQKSVAERSFDSAILQQVLQHLQSTAEIVKDPAPGVLYRVNGVDITVADVWNDIRPFVTTMEVRAAKQWIVNSTLVRQELQKAGVWLSAEEAAKKYEEMSAPYKDSIFSIENLAVAVKNFPSVDRFKEYTRMLDSFAQYKAKEMTPENLKKHAEERTNRVIGQVSADVDVILCSAFDFKTQRWKENGWADAEARMKDVVNLLVEEQQPWDVLVEKYSDFYEPPTPLSQRGQEDPNRSTKGRFRNIQRNTLLGQLGEHDYWMFLNGSSITDFVFFQQEVQSLGQPMRGPLGWYLPRLMRRTKPPQRLSMDPKTQDELVRDDYLTYHLNLFAQELVNKSEVFGLEFPGASSK